MSYSSARDLIMQAIQKEGKITFARFMELALFTPGTGYYTGTDADPYGRDYYTSPGAHPLFGALVALQLEQVWRLLGKPSPFWAIELGAGSGLLGRAVVSFSKTVSVPFSRALIYVAVEARTMRPLYSHPDGLQWARSNSIPFQGVKGCLVCNELLDSFPVHRIAMVKGTLKEVYVACQGESIVEVMDEPSDPLIQRRLEEEGIALEEGQQAEVNLAVNPWLEAASKALEQGALLIFDYGDSAQGLYSERRRQGTMRAYYRHAQTNDLYARPGQQDLTAHVDFTAVVSAARNAGFHMAGFASQRDFLLNLGLSSFVRALRDLKLPQHLEDANRLGMLELARPEGLGSFKVLALSKGLQEVDLYGFMPDNPLKHASILNPPLLTDEHLPLLRAKYPHLAWDWEHLWETQKLKEQ